MGWKFTAGADETVGKVATSSEEFQDKPCEDEQSGENGVEDEVDQGRSIHIETQRNLRKSKEEETAPKPMMQHCMDCNSLSELFATAPADEGAEKGLEDDTDI